MQRGTGAAPLCVVEQVLRVVQPLNLEPRLGQQVRVPPLPARDVEDARARRQGQQLDEPRDLVPVTYEFEDRLVLEQVLRVEVAGPPVRSLRSRAQKNTGSR